MYFRRLFLLFSPRDDGPSNVRTEPKFIVFLSQLLLLFRVCPVCKADGLLTEHRVIGTMVEIASFCANPKCQKRENIWRSQPEMPGTKIAAGNFLLSFAILVGGASATKVRTVFNHMGLACISLQTYYAHQRVMIYYNDSFLTGINLVIYELHSNRRCLAHDHY